MTAELLNPPEPTSQQGRTATVREAARMAQQDPAWVRWTLIAAALAIVGVLIIIPVANIFAVALSEGLGVYLKNLFGDPDTLHSIALTLTVAPIALLANLVF